MPVVVIDPGINERLIKIKIKCLSGFQKGQLEYEKWFWGGTFGDGG